MRQQWVLASNNQGKLAEFNSLFANAGLDIDIITQGSLGITDAVEDGLSFIENAIIKARHAARASGLPALADDSGLVVPLLNGAPGIYSARYAGAHGDDAANNQRLIDELIPYHQVGETIPAFFVCVLAAVLHADDPLPTIAIGQWHGQILPAPKGENGFGYDPLFYVPSLAKTSAELTKSEKNALSHRAQALKSLITQLKSIR